MQRGLIKGVAGVIALVMNAPIAMASPDIPEVDALSPGVALAPYDATLSGGVTCTAGFLVRDHRGQTGLLSAGHCDEGGPVTLRLSGVTSTQIGPFNPGMRHGDIGFVALLPGVPVNPSITETEPVRGVSDPVTTDEVLCKVGAGSGRQCGPVTGVGAGTVTFAATTQCGDSGGPVYAVNPDGSVTAVGITIAETLGAGTIAPPCGTPATYAVAQLIQPWLHDSAMTLLTS